MKVLITGATGFIGSHLTEQLVEEGHGVKALARQSSDISLLKSLDVEFTLGDIRDANAVRKAVNGCEQVYHLAAMRDTHRASRQEYYTVNVEGTKHLALACMRADVRRLVYGSTTGVYGSIRNSTVDEETEPNPNTPYRESKLLAEKLLLSCQKKKGLPVVIARLSGVFGPRSLNFLGLIQAIAQEHFRIIGSGENQIQAGYISDVLEGLRGCAETSGIEGESYLISGIEPIRLKQLVEIISQELGVKTASLKSPELPFRMYHFLNAFVFRHFSIELPRAHVYEFFLSNSVFDTSKAQKQLGYSPRVSMNEGLQKTVKWYRENGYV